MKYAIVTSGGKQYKVSEGTVLELDKLAVEPGAEYKLDKVLLAVDGDAVTLGKPYIENFVVTAKVLEQTQGDKIRVSQFKAKARHRRVMGYRAQLTKVEITGLNSKAEKKTVAKEKKAE
jgi:large subunit ribosomal protein L21